MGPGGSPTSCDSAVPGSSGRHRSSFHTVARLLFFMEYFRGVFFIWGNRLILFPVLLLQPPCPSLTCCNMTAAPQSAPGRPGIFTRPRVQPSHRFPQPLRLLITSSVPPPALMQITGQTFAWKCHILSVFLPLKNFQRDSSNRKQRQKSLREHHTGQELIFIKFLEVILPITYS